jgi:hypothetical protein
MENNYFANLENWKLGKIFGSLDICIWKFCVFMDFGIFGIWNYYFANLEISKLTKIFGIWNNYFANLEN